MKLCTSLTYTYTKDILKIQQNLPMHFPTIGNFVDKNYKHGRIELLPRANSQTALSVINSVPT